MSTGGFICYWQAWVQQLFQEPEGENGCIAVPIMKKTYRPFRSRTIVTSTIASTMPVKGLYSELEATDEEEEVQKE